MACKVLLFDIDATLLLSGNAGGRALNRTFFELYGIPGAFDIVRPHGKTDPMIFREMLAAWMPDRPPERELEKIAERYLEYLEEELDTSPGFRVMPGVKPLLEALAGEPTLALGLATGNLERGAWLKLRRGGLDGFFRFGGFGSDAEDRAELVRIAVVRAENHLGRRVVPAQDVYVIGDTDRDIRCGREAGTRTVAVATGPSGPEELARHGPDHVFRDFSDVKRAVEFFCSLGGEPGL